MKIPLVFEFQLFAEVYQPRQVHIERLQTGIEKKRITSAYAEDDRTSFCCGMRKRMAGEKKNENK
jgi:hypothetical protein